MDLKRLRTFVVVADLGTVSKAALRLADRLTAEDPTVDEPFYKAVRSHFSDEQILDLGMTITFASGWQRFIEAFGIVPDRWRDGAPPPFHALMGGPDMAPQTPSARNTPAEAVAPLDCPRD